MEKYLTMQYWFGNPIPPSVTLADQTIFGISLALTIAGFALMYYKVHVKDRPKKALLNRVYNLLLTVGIFGMLWFGLRYELIQMFGTRFVVGLIYLSGLVRAYFVWRYYKQVYLKEKYLSEQEQIKSRYM
jgi:hypothetical protein